MTRLAATLSTPVSLWSSLSATFRGIALSFGTIDVSGLAAVERESAKVRDSGRHWLM